MKDSCEYLIETDNLIELKKITPKLKEALRFSNVIGDEHRSSSWKNLSGENGIKMMKILKWCEQLSISDNIFSAGTKYPTHQHKGHEVVIVYKGRLELTINGRVIILTDVAKPYYFKADQPHSALFTEDSEVIAITIPGDTDWKKVMYGRAEGDE